MDKKIVEINVFIVKKVIQLHTCTRTRTHLDFIFISSEMKLQHKQNRSLIRLWKFTVSACQQYDMSQKNNFASRLHLVARKGR